MPIGDKKPRGWLRLAFRRPVGLYRLHLGWLLGERFLLLTHTGRTSRRPHQTVIEVVHHEKSRDIYYVISGFGRRSDWFLNLKRNPKAMITVGWRTLPVRAREIPEAEGAGILLGYAARHPTAFRELATLLTGKPIDPNEGNCREFLRTMPLVAFQSAGA